MVSEAENKTEKLNLQKIKLEMQINIADNEGRYTKIDGL